MVNCLIVNKLQTINKDIMAVTMAEISKLRTMTGAGMMDCKNALIEAESDFEKAVEIIRKKGQADALFHRNVGAIQLLRDAGHPGAVHGGARGERWTRV